jgi:hypothetical protein
MNERIKEIYDAVVNDYGKYTFESYLAEKFAELIVRECANTIQDFVDHRFPASEYPLRLKRYFGVEE